MKLSSLQENLKQGLLMVGHVAGKNINLPILNNVLIEAKEGNIRLTATNLEMGIVSVIRGRVEEEGALTVDSKIITDYISLLPNKKVDIKQKENSLNVETENYKTKISGQNAEDFPLIPKIERTTFYSANISEIKRALGQVIFAVAASETRIELSGVLFCFNKDTLTMAATDSYRLAERAMKIKSNAEDKELKKIIIPSRALQELARILSGIRDEENVEGGLNEIKFYVSDNQILFNIGATDLVSRLIEGQYPDYKQIIPSQHKTKAIVNRNELIRAVKVASIFSKTGINDINLDFPRDKNQVVVSSASGQTGENITEVDAHATGDDNGIVVNHRYLLDGLNNFDGENVIIEVIDSNTPCIVRPEKGEGGLYVIMPIKQ